MSVEVCGGACAFCLNTPASSRGHMYIYMVHGPGRLVPVTFFSFLLYYYFYFRKKKNEKEKLYSNDRLLLQQPHSSSLAELKIMRRKEGKLK